MELAKYRIDIAALCETRFPESGSLNDLDYTFFWSGKPDGEKREAGVGFAIRKDIVSSVYAPTLTNTDEKKEAFYNQLACTLRQVPHTDKLILMGDLNARIGSDYDKWPLRDERKTTWMHPRSKHWHMIDFIITSKQGSKKPSKLNIAKLNAIDHRESLARDMNDAIDKLDVEEGSSVDQEWTALQQVVFNTTKTSLGKPNRRHQDWFDPDDQKLLKLLNNRDQAHQKVLQSRSTRSTVAAYKVACRQLQQHTRVLKTAWWDRKAEELQRAADRNDMKGFYSGLKEIWGPQKKGPVQLKSADGQEIFSDKKRVLERWSEHFQKLLNVPGEIEPEALDNIQQRTIKTCLDETPSMDETMKAIMGLKDGKAPGGDGIPAEVWKYGGTNLLVKLHQLIHKAWDEGSVPQAWKDATIITIYKKGDRTDCGNYRGISLLSVAGKVFARILLDRLSQHITPEVVPESQCGFRSNRSTIDMIFSLRQIQEKCIEQDQPLYMVFVDFTKAFDTVGRTGLWKLLRKYGCPEKFTSMIESLHTGMKANVRDGGETSETFDVTNGVKQGCVLAPTLFSILLSAMLKEAFQGMKDGVYIQSRPDADLFNTTHFKARTKSTLVLIRELLFADDSALLAHSPQEIQRIINAFSDASKKFGLKINIKKTEVLYQPNSSRTQEVDVRVDGNILNSVPEFTYLGSTVTKDGQIDAEIQRRMAKASASFGRLHQRLWNNHHVSMKVKGKIYRAVVISTLLYGAESWTVYRRHVKKLHAFMMRHLRSILKITWIDKMTNKEILDRTGLSSMEDLLIRKNLRWTGHLMRMPQDRLPKQILFSQLHVGHRKRGRPRLRYKDTIKRNLKQRNIKLESWAKLSKQRSEWRTAEEVEEHLRQVHSNSRREVSLEEMGKLINPTEIVIPFRVEEPSWQEMNTFLSKARAKSAPGPNGTGIKEFRTISLLNVEGKIFLQILAKGLTSFMMDNSYMDTSVQKGGVPGVAGCLEHTSIITKIIKDLKKNHGDLAVLWLDLTNAYGTMPHRLVDLTMKTYHVPEHFQKLVQSYYDGFNMCFICGDFTAE
ncbi:hypothetical protein QTP70_008422 [Hemibagrus guttatus]|uniref:Reverse transcriptase domain-containing protein n=1 Tax=Hemibagrus guttatus TaxID=175788 RepID=A0AAE0PWY9_9TELE|nr:hypothetical protein QTP70_008422 [Hemibagrus guttatus]